jgi:hypothetical protein
MPYRSYGPVFGVGVNKHRELAPEFATSRTLTTRKQNLAIVVGEVKAVLGFAFHPQLLVFADSHLLILGGLRRSVIWQLKARNAQRAIIR